MHTRTPKAKINFQENFTYRLLDKDGKVKQLWKDNALGALVLRVTRKLVKDPIAFITASNGEVERSYVKPGLLNKIAAYGVRINGITGNYVNELKLANIITNTGKAAVASRINGNGGEALFNYIAIGIGTTAAAATQTALVSEITTGGGARAIATVSRTTTTVTNDTARLVLTFTFSSSFAVTEAGAFNAASAGVMLNRQVFSAVNVVSTDTLQVTIDISVS